MKGLPFVSIIVPVYNGEATIEACIRSLSDLRYPKERYEVLVVDNNSTDNTATIVKKHPVRYLVEDETQSSYATRNRGIREARGEILAFTDADVVVGRNWLKRALDCLQDGEADMVAGAVEIVTHDPPNLWEACDRYMFLNQERCVQEGFGLTANLLVRREVFEDVGLFEERLLSSGDYEFGRRATGKGHSLVYCREAKVCHPARASLGALLKKSRRLGYGKAQLAILGKKRLPYALLLRSALPPVLSLARGFDLSPKPPFSQQIALFPIIYCLKLTFLYGYLRYRLQHVDR
jgi:glycosyltransferase involved in cell wall biosynthesis